MNERYERAKHEAVKTVKTTATSVREAVVRAGYRHGLDEKHLDRLTHEVREETSFAPSLEVRKL